MAGAATVQLACIAEKSHDERLLGIAQMQSAYASWVNKEATLTQTFYLCTLAQCCLLIDRYEESQTYLNKAVDLIEQSGERYFETEVYRTLAQLFMQRQPTLDSLNKAQSLLDTAYQDATSRGLFGMALRLALTMHEWEQVSHQKATWLAAGITTNALLTQSMAAVEAHASSQDAMRCRRLLIQQENSIVQKEISCLPK
jgi:tetratricopeptide (TPR) repeat protein